MNLNEKLTAIQSELHVKKSKYNKFGKYYYRAAEDILEALKPFAVKYKVTFSSTEELISDMVIKTTAIIQDHESDGIESRSAIVGVEKAGGMALPQAFGSASSYGKKYAYGNLLMIDDSEDADVTQGTPQGVKKTLTAQPTTTRKPQINTENIDKAKAFIARGGLLATLKEKYDISDEALKDLE